MAFPVGNLAALRTFRVLRALKTVAVVPGKTLTSMLRFVHTGRGSLRCGAVRRRAARQRNATHPV